jgi:iron(III) transport system ATP-binding protein
MIGLQIQQLTKRFGATVALDQLDLAIRPGELFFLLGPSGCGKTTLLRCLAGFCVPDSGRILFGDEDVTALPAHRRQTGMVFQSYALWPHLTVAENVAFGLVERRVPKAEITARVAAALAAVRMGELGACRPNQLSGGQQQRVALARALIVRPRCLLLDEPLSNLDAQLRQELRAEIRRVCVESKLTTVYVTHDQKEALAIADRLAVLDRGRILQVGTPREVYRRPVSRSVAQFIGESNLLPGKFISGADGRVFVETPVGRFEGVMGDPTARPASGAAVTLSVRPECWTLHRTPPAGNALRGRIGGSVYLGEMAQHEFVTAGSTLKIYELNPRQVAATDSGDMFAAADPEDVVVLTG